MSFPRQPAASPPCSSSCRLSPTCWFYCGQGHAYFLDVPGATRRGVQLASAGILVAPCCYYLSGERILPPDGVVSSSLDEGVGSPFNEGQGGLWAMSYPTNVSGKFSLQGMGCFSRLLQTLSTVAELVGQHHGLALLPFLVFLCLPCVLCCNLLLASMYLVIGIVNSKMVSS